MDYAKESLRLHGEWKGKIEVVATVPVATKEDLSLAYTPGVFRGTFDVRASDINEEMKMAAAMALANLISDEELNEDYILPKAFDPRVGPAVAKAVAEAARATGVASKVTMITGMVCIGFGQGVQALLGYCVGANLWDRFKKIMTFSVLFSLGLSSVMTGICYLFTDQIVSVFLTEQAAFDYAAQFVRILLTTSFLFGVFYVLANALQAAGAATAALIINLSRQGFIYIPALFVLKAAIGANGLAWAQPVADLLSTALVVFLYVRTVKKMEANSQTHIPSVE